jgi:Uma2 family endonuclease
LNLEHLELVEGELIDKMGKNRPHVTVMILLQRWLQDTFGWRFVNPEAPIDVAPEDNPTSEPVPDIVVTKLDLSNFRSTRPRSEDLALVVEIADTTLAFDLTTKAHLYARAGIVEYWVVDVIGRRLVVHRNPALGKYTSITAYSETETASPLAAPHAELRLADVL